ncbi:hypothetical protein ACWEN3_45095, partial [Streptomyces sp. NPDC004561]
MRRDRLGELIGKLRQGGLQPTAEDVADALWLARLETGMTLGIGGWGSRRKPMALVRALLRS